VEVHQRGALGRLRDQRRQIAQQIAAARQRRVAARDGGRTAQPLQPVVLTRPDQGLEPAGDWTPAY
jgi:hypothetical protein